MKWKSVTLENIDLVCIKALTTGTSVQTAVCTWRYHNIADLNRLKWLPPLASSGKRHVNEQAKHLHHSNSTGSTFPWDVISPDASPSMLIFQTCAVNKQSLSDLRPYKLHLLEEKLNENLPNVGIINITSLISQ